MIPVFAALLSDALMLSPHLIYWAERSPIRHPQSMSKSFQVLRHVESRIASLKSPRIFLLAFIYTRSTRKRGVPSPIDVVVVVVVVRQYSN